MLQNKSNKSLLPKQFLFRLTFINIIVIASFIILSSWAIYNTACVLADGIITMADQKQSQFESTLFQYLWLFSISTIIIGSLIHFYLMRRLIHPLRELIHSTKKMKKGQYPKPIKVKSNDEIGQLIIHFNDMVKQLKDSEDHRKKLVSDLSHEFRTPLTNLNGYLNALRNDIVEADHNMYQSLYKESERLLYLVEQIEQLNDWDYVSKQAFSEKEQVDIRALIKQSTEMFRWTLVEANINLDVQVQSSYVTVNKERIQQVLSNLIDNAIRYYLGDEPITIKGEIMESDYIISISGPGQPIPRKDQKRIFERFYRMEHSRSKELGGTGLGLAISKEIIEQHKGKIGMKSEHKQNTFWFSLPLELIN